MKTIMTAAIAIALSSPAWGQGAGIGADRIGHATLIKGQVQQELSRQSYPLSRYDPVYHKAWIATRELSQAELEFLDQSHLSVGPSSRVILDEAVFDPAKRYGRVSMRVTAGSYQLIINPRDQRRYTVRTPYATIGATGTVLEIVVVKPRGKRRGRR